MKHSSGLQHVTGARAGGIRSLHPLRPGCQRVASRRAQPARPSSTAAQQHVQLQDFLADCRSLGMCRFIVISDSTILETVATFSSVKVSDTARGPLATLSSDDRSFECHLSTEKVKQVQLMSGKARNGDHQTYSTRFLTDAGQLVLSVLLHGPGGKYAPGAVEAWDGLRTKYGEVSAFQ